jgi:hypothetical protein
VDVVHYGARHMALRDGMWLQPEPLLHLGLTNGNLRSPVGYSGVYAGGDSNRWSDLSGYILNVAGDTAAFETASEIALGGGVDVSVGSNGDVSMSAGEGFDPAGLSVDQRALYDAMSTSIGQDATTSMTVVRHDPGVPLASAVGTPGNTTGRQIVDVGDIGLLGPQRPMSSSMVLAHEIVEATLITGNGVSQRAAHKAADQFIAARTGWERTSHSEGEVPGTNLVQWKNTFRNGPDVAGVVLRQPYGPSSSNEMQVSRW